MANLTHSLKRQTLILLIVSAFLMQTPQIAFGLSIARYSGEFMAGGGGARALAMGGAQTALSDDAWAIFWNPAGIGRSDISQLGLMHSERFDGVVDYDAAALILPQLDGSNLSFGLIRLGVNGISLTRLENEYPNAEPSNGNRVEVSDIVSEGEYAFFAGKARYLGQWLVGVSPKLIFKHIGSNQAYGLGVDLGVRGRPVSFLPIEAGLAIRDFLGTLVAWDTGHKEVIVSTIRLGLAGNINMPALEAEITPAVDLAYRLENAGGSDAASLHLGLEYVIRQTVALRIGSDEDRLTFGGGIILKPVSIDYAFIGHDELGDTHRISIIARWGKSG